MKIEKYTKDTFVVIGKEGSTLDGQGFIQELWSDANSHFSEVQPLAKKDENGNLVGIWGAMSDCSHSYKPWENNFSQGLYLAGVECVDDAEAPEGWTKWTIPGYEYICAEVENENTFSEVLDYMGRITSHWLEPSTILLVLQVGRTICFFRLEAFNQIPICLIVAPHRQVCYLKLRLALPTLDHMTALSSDGAGFLCA